MLFHHEPSEPLNNAALGQQRHPFCTAKHRKTPVLQASAEHFCALQVLKYLSENLSAAPEVLGDPQRESPEELRERQERVAASSLLAVGYLSELVESSAGSRSGTLELNRTQLPK